MKSYSMAAVLAATLVLGSAGASAQAAVPVARVTSAATAKITPASRVRRITENVVVHPDGTSVRTMHIEVQAINAAAAMEIGQTSLTYDSALQTLDIVSAYTLKKDGTKIPVDVRAIYDQLAPGATQIPMFTDDHAKVIVFPQFTAGDTAVYTVKIRTKKPYFPGQFWYGDFYPTTVAYDSIDETVTAPKSMHLKVETYDVAFNKKDDGNNIVYHWHYSAPNPTPPQKLAVAELSATPHFFVTTFRNYAALGRAYAVAAAPKTVVTPQIQALADRITKSAHGEKAKAQALYAWVSHHIRYVAVELGRGSFVPHAAQTVLTNGYGDCKDHVTLLRTLLKAEDIASEPVLINALNDYTLTEVPTFFGLDHVIIYIPNLKTFLDSTAMVAPFGVLPLSEYGKPVVFATEHGTHRGTTPVLAPSQASINTTTVSTLGADGTLVGKTTTTATGPFSILLRTLGLGIQAAGPGPAASQVLSRLGYGSDARGSLEAPPPTQLGPSYTIVGTFKDSSWKRDLAGKHDFYLPGGMRLMGLSGDGIMGSYSNSHFKADTPRPCYSATATETLSLTVPDSVRFDHVPSDVHIKTDYLRFDAHWSLSGDTLRVHRSFVSTIDQALCTPAIREANAKALKAIGESFDAELGLEAAGAAHTAVNGAAPHQTPKATSLIHEGWEDIQDGKFQLAVEAFRKAAEQGYADAQYNLGVMYYHGQGVPQSYVKAAQWHRKAAEQGYADAQLNLGAMYYHDQGVPQSYAKAAQWYCKAAEQGNAIAQYDLGVMYDHGQGVPQSYAKAAQWYRKAAVQGDAYAQYNLGIMYHNGQGVPQSYAKSAQWFRKVAEQGVAAAQYNLGFMYDHGQGVPQSYAKAAQWFRKAAEQGYADAQYNLGVTYQFGEGVPQNYAKAAYWYRKAAQQGFAGAQFNLGGMYGRGEGVPQNYLKAYKWLELAKVGFNADSKSLNWINQAMQKLGATMTASQIAQAQDMASKWYAAHAKK